MTAESSELMTRDLALTLLAALPAEVGPGLSDAELDAVEARFGFRFAADHRTFLQAGLPLGKSWPDWRGADPEELRGRLDWPTHGVMFDVKHGFWYPGWGTEPESRQQALQLAAARLREVPQLVPVYSHRYLPGIKGEIGHPVLSVYQTDIIYYGNDLADYLRHEFGIGPSRSLAATRTTLPFWSYFLDDDDGGLAEDTTTTPHDPYAATAQEAVENLRMLAIELSVGRGVDTDTLVQAALVAYALGADSPALRDLASYSLRDGGEAQRLFSQALDELDLTAQLPSTDRDARWTLLRWWLELISNGSMDAIEGGKLINEAGDRLGCSEALRSFRAWTIQWDDWSEDWGMPREVYKQRIVDDARRLLAGPWPPPS
ncbi:hypothetical protein ABIA32_000010 [Streptacidiphilus sp. MAP12-20]|uniref:hypothetical protein n=1 Tax=Streptacidiphilus sp. MAP12-20 TaxID=3156299 RepID=UPI003511D912